MIRPAPAVLVALCLASIGGCGSPPDAQNEQIAKEGVERRNLLEASKEHPAARGEKDAIGKPLPPLPGVNAPVPKKASPHDGMSEHDHH